MLTLVPSDSALTQLVLNDIVQPTQSTLEYGYGSVCEVRRERGSHKSSPRLETLKRWSAAL